MPRGIKGSGRAQVFTVVVAFTVLRDEQVAGPKPYRQDANYLVARSTMIQQCSELPAGADQAARYIKQGYAVRVYPGLSKVAGVELVPVWSEGLEPPVQRARPGRPKKHTGVY